VTRQRLSGCPATTFRAKWLEVLWGEQFTFGRSRLPLSGSNRPRRFKRWPQLVEGEIGTRDRPERKSALLVGETCSLGTGPDGIPALVSFFVGGKRRYLAHAVRRADCGPLGFSAGASAASIPDVLGSKPYSFRDRTRCR
jgi:hypothetical protein